MTTEHSMNMFIILLLIINLNICLANWTLLWNDEFDQARLNYEEKKWDIEDTGNRCNEPFSSQLNCMTARDENVRTIDGTLAITALHQDKITTYYKKPFTSAYIYSAEYFTQGKFEVRAAIPKGDLLRAQINLYEPQEKDNTWVGIALVDFKQRNTFEVGVWDMGGNFSSIYSYEHGADLHDYHVYTLERDVGFLRWYFDGYNFYNYSLESIDERLVDRMNGEMEIDVNLVVGGPMMDNWTMHTFENWNCSSLIVDYVRVFTNVNEQAENEESPHLNNTDKLPSSICKRVQELVFEKSTGSDESSKTYNGFSMKSIYYSIAVIFILVIVIGVLFWRQHKIQMARQDEQGKQESNKEENLYDIYSDGTYDNIAQDSMYEQVNDETVAYLEVYDDIRDQTPKFEQPRYEKMTRSPKLELKQMNNKGDYV